MPMRKLVTDSLFEWNITHVGRLLSLSRHEAWAIAYCKQIETFSRDFFIIKTATLIIVCIIFIPC